MGGGLVLLLSAVDVLALSHAHGDDPWDAPDSAFMGTGPGIMDQTTVDSNLATKTAIQTHDDQVQQAAQTTFSGSKGATAVPPASAPNTAPPTGILSDAERLPLLPGWGSLYNIVTTWQMLSGGTRYAAYAGLKYDSSISTQVDTSKQPAQGVLIILTVPTDTNSTPTDSMSGEYLTPTRSGAVHITAVNGMCLTLLSKNGTSFQFNVTTHTWSCGTTTNPAP